MATITKPFKSILQMGKISVADGSLIDFDTQPSYSLNVSYNFGSKKIKSARNRKTSLDDASKRVGE